MMVYVDNLELPFGKMLMCHMIADTRQELLEMVDQIGVQRKWIQDLGTKREHFDISKAKKKLAIEKGAELINMRDLAQMLIDRDMNIYLQEKKQLSDGKMEKQGHPL
jgi:hypothetical protein